MSNAAKGLAGFANILVIASLVIMIVYSIKVGGSDIHVLLSVIGYFMFLQAMLWVSFNMYYMNQVIAIIGTILVTIGTIMHLKDKGFTGTIHAWLGVAAFGLLLAAVILYLIFTFININSGYLIVSILSKLAVIFASAALISGLFIERYKEWGPSWFFVTHVVIVATYSIILVLMLFV